MFHRASFLFFLALLQASSSLDFLKERIQPEHRFVVFNSRQLTGECLPICVPEAETIPADTAAPTQNPTEAPTPGPTIKPTAAPTEAPTPGPTNKPTVSPTQSPTNQPTAAPTLSPTIKPTAAPTGGPTPSPTIKPTAAPTGAPTPSPTNKPTAAPTGAPTPSPTNKPTAAPTGAPTPSPTIKPTAAPTKAPTPSPTKNPTPSPTACPVPMTAQCETAIDCLNRNDIGILNCPSCVNNVCVSKPAVNGNLNCCKRTPGNDLVIANGCGANNICFGFNLNDQCEVNQHAAYCHPSCPGGNLNAALTAIDPTKCTHLGNDQGSKGMPFIYPMDYCMTRDIKWKKGISGQWTEMPPLDKKTAPVDPKPTTSAVCNPPITPECVDALDCVNHPKHDAMQCPSCVSGMCINMPEDINGNLNCCKITPGNTKGIITNGCGANNICWGFNENDQCEVNQHAAYCHPSCPLGNLDSKGKVDPTKCTHMDNDQGSKGMPPIYPMSYCACRDIKWKNNDTVDNIPVSCGPISF
ncbi:outer membrane adhesin like protein [Nitzschia inconspicua]|uniref:Outer membrane adhesin like protein n=1 Tax=Nitzschia inconspicua TaxID=303405 RepID=A0A9K3LKM8_9STRA|nr:outer membrane adhesin like protein [Nitzschia inconspicua]